MGHLDILFCNAGIMGKTIGPKGNIQDVPAELFEETWRVNTGVHYLVCIQSCNGGFSFNT